MNWKKIAIHNCFEHLGQTNQRYQDIVRLQFIKANICWDTVKINAYNVQMQVTEQCMF